MRNSKEDTVCNLSITFFLILFALFVFTSSNNNWNHYSSYKGNTRQSGLVFGDLPGRQNAILSNALKLPDIQKYYEWALNTTSPDPFSIQYLISDYNHRIAQNLIQIRKTELAIEPLLLWRFRNALSVSDTGDLPVLS